MPRTHAKSLLTAAALALTAACSNTATTPSSLNPQQPGTTGTQIQVTIPANAAGLGTAAYGANPLSISAGITVQWNNSDTMAHTVTADDGSFDSGPLNPGQSFSHTFNAPGTFPYHCTIHGKTSMSGVVQVGNGATGLTEPGPLPQ
jgi:plastocyanin